jgi:hypothetical protein
MHNRQHTNICFNTAHFVKPPAITPLAVLQHRVSVCCTAAAVAVVAVARTRTQCQQKLLFVLNGEYNDCSANVKDPAVSVILLVGARDLMHAWH